MTVRNEQIVDIDAIMNEKFGQVGSEEREQFRRDAYAYCMGQVIYEARKNEKITQSELAARIGSSKSYISRIEKGLIEPSVGTFYRIMDDLGFRNEIVKHVK